MNSKITMTVLPNDRLYLKGAERLAWFRRDRPNASITTEVLHVGDGWCVVRATISEAGIVLATAHKMETKDNWPEFVESAESWAIGRALGFCGYGTLNAIWLDEGERVIDSPVPKGGNDGVRGSYIVKFGNQYHGKKLSDIEENRLRAYIAWLEGEIKMGKIDYPDAKELVAKAHEYLNG